MNSNNEIQEPIAAQANVSAPESPAERGRSCAQQGPNARWFRVVSTPSNTSEIAADRNVRAPMAAPQYTGLSASLFCVFAVGMALTGCGFLKPTPSMERHFVLTPSPTTEGTTNAPLSVGVGVGVGQVKVAPYLFNNSLAVRQGTNEIRYLQSVLWAEHLDSAIQRVLAANLSSSLHTQRIRLSSWRSDEVSAEVYVTIEQLDVSSAGEGVLVAWWRILSPGGEKTLKSGKGHLVRQGPSPEREPSGAIATLSGLVGEFSGQLAQAINETEAWGATPPTVLRSSP